ncbi:response regulator transcription factor family protein [Nocardioides sp. TF02-7]|uniref:helix-turn-helix transcriptional regulator n=1 Tax=Nocardioides sp. TF02-7 TaxID=2917724 RepID=UPI001F05E158|nr:response regulator transcription factor family protein [Nocardioides sp. TF02-7]UMG93772.1 response regulator [Nocardioides sp. TF02-7]
MLGLLVVARLAFRLRSGTERERRGLAWFLGAHVLVAVGYLAFEIGLSREGRWLLAGVALIFLAEVMLPASVFVLIRRQTSWRVDLAVSRTLVWALLTASLVAAYVLAVWGLSMVAPWDEESSGVVVVAGLALAVLPLRDLLQRQVERLVFGSGADPSVLLQRVAHALDAADDDSPLLAGLLASLRRALRLGHVAVALHGTPVASAGRWDADADGRAVRIELGSGGRVAGVLTAAAPRGERLDPRSIRLLRQISGLVAVAAQLDDTNRALERARARLVEVRHEERRLLRRELHDGLGPALSGTALALAAVPHTSALSPDDAVLLRRLGEELTRRAEDVRQMARVLLPPVLDDGRLGEALRLLAERHSTSRFAVSVDAPYADRLDGIHQVVVYQVAAEAVRNAWRHAEAHRCLVRLELPAAGGVRLEVCDDGRGIGDGVEPGVGMRSMRGARRGARRHGDGRRRPGRDAGGDGAPMTAVGSIRVLVVDDHPVFRLGMAALLRTLPDVELVAEAATGADALAAAERDRPDVVLMDLDLGADSGVETTRELLRRDPMIGVLVVTMLGDDDSLFASIRAGARGFLLKGASPEEVERAVRSVANGDFLMGPQLAQRAAVYLSGARTRGAVPFPELTDREREVVDLVARGYDNATIARRLVLSAKTVRNYVYGVLAKLDVPDRAQLIVRAREAGLGGDETD